VGTIDEIGAGEAVVEAAAVQDVERSRKAAGIHCLSFMDSVQMWNLSLIVKPCYKALS
jgi:hypothetical protein